MDRFDRYADEYQDLMSRSVALVGQSHDFFLKLKVRLLLDLVARRIGDSQQARLLDVGCGIGLIERALVGQVGSLYGIDVSQRSVRLATEGTAGATFLHYDGQRLPFADDVFDLTYAVCVLHHVPAAKWSGFVAEMARVVRPGGLALIIEHNPITPLTRLVVSRCELDKDATLLSARRCRKLLRGAGLDIVEQRYFAFIPFSLPGAAHVERGLAWLPLGAQYYLAATKG